jgi:hypothetical protein
MPAKIRLKPSLSNLADQWPSAYIARSEIKNFTGGVISKKYLANLDSAGKGPEGRIKIGRKVAYPVRNLIAWLESRAEMLSDHE